MYYNQGTLLMVSTPQQDQDILWSISSEPFPFRPYLAESTTVVPLDGMVWGLAEMKAKTKSTLNNVLRNAQKPKRVVLLTNQGAHIISLLKPVDILQQLLVACHGPHHDAVKAYFQTQSESQACATSLLLACMDVFRGTDIAMWAAQAFLLYGGEPYFGNTGFPQRSYVGSPGTIDKNAAIFMSTPFPSRAAASIQQNLMQHTQFPPSPSNCFQYL